MKLFQLIFIVAVMWLPAPAQDSVTLPAAVVYMKKAFVDHLELASDEAPKLWDAQDNPKAYKKVILEMLDGRIEIMNDALKSDIDSLKSSQRSYQGIRKRYFEEVNPEYKANFKHMAELTQIMAEKEAITLVITKKQIKALRDLKLKLESYRINSPK